MGVAVEMNVRKLPGPMDAPPLLRTVIQRWIPQSELRGSSWDTAYSTAGHTLYLANGSFLEFLSCDIVDEAMMICPQCRSWYNTVHDRVTATMVLRNAGLPMDGQFFPFRIRDLIQHAPLIAPLRAAGIPLRETTGIQSGSAATQQRRWATSR